MFTGVLSSGALEEVYQRVGPKLKLKNSLQHFAHPFSVFRGVKNSEIKFSVDFPPQSPLTHTVFKRTQHIENLKHLLRTPIIGHCPPCPNAEKIGVIGGLNLPQA